MKNRFKKIYIEITNICNLECKFCINSNRKKEYMSLEDFQLVISKIKDYTDLIALHVKGEPLMHPKLKEILDVCFVNNILVNITTNTTLLDRNIEILSKSKALRQINLSMHAMIQNNMNINENVNKIISLIRKLRFFNKDIIISYRLWNVSNINKNYVNQEILNLIGKEYNVQNILNRSREEKFIKLDSNVFLNQDIEFEWPDLKLDKISDKGKCYRFKKSNWNFSKWRCSSMLLR